ncbi:hypothetical protein FJR45_09820 [Sulfurimonas sediminis]|uniref:Uncharacterized protein n=1 Tax=Sulfurimonas sediminis TaxID=2590020 RepID=A0A7M1B3J0_9BACT|nr:hypothetical protein [Sulfurimonas sediminis]QOP44225.1 hypothetical protein FJR45_09820 [Sulfurimonas sediminis]
MLESTVWRQYHDDNSFREKLAEFCKLDTVDLIEDDKELYAALKAKLTKKELKLFAMDTAGIAQGRIKKEFAYTDEELEKAKFKLYKKLIQDKTRLSFRV